jgi:adenylyl-sulfate kinase
MQINSISGNTAWTIWFTGLSGAGKSTLASALANHLAEHYLACELIDGDEIRRELCSDLGYSKADRDENVRRISYVARVLNRHGVISIVAAISPYREARLEARRKSARFIEVHVDCPLQDLIQRDTKGLYAKALNGSIQKFTGISDPYEAPIDPEIYVNSALQSEEESLAHILAQLAELGLLSLNASRLRPTRLRA